MTTKPAKRRARVSQADHRRWRRERAITERLTRWPIWMLRLLRPIGEVPALLVTSGRARPIALIVWCHKYDRTLEKAALKLATAIREDHAKAGVAPRVQGLFLHDLRGRDASQLPRELFGNVLAPVTASGVQMAERLGGCAIFEKVDHGPDMWFLRAILNRRYISLPSTVIKPLTRATAA